MGSKAEVAAYPGGCNQSPAWMWIAPDNVLDPKGARAIFAHEFMHMIQFAYTKGTNCMEYRWMDEATANWAIDHVYPDDNYEHGFFESYLIEPNTISREGMRTELNVPLDLSLWRASSRLCPGGYCDYPFFLYIAERFGADRIRRIYEASELFDPIDSIASGVDGPLRNVWHDFSLALYNDVDEGIKNQFYEWDGIRFGILSTVLDDGWDPHGIIEMDLAGAAERAHNLNAGIALAFGTRAAGSAELGNAPLPRLSTRPISLQFTDDAVSYVVLRNPLAFLPFPDVKIWAIERVNGVWKAPEDWTHRGVVTYCRDNAEERIEELVLIYSNGDTASRGTTGNWYVELDPNAYHDQDFGLLPQVALSNAGCWQWRGSASVTVNAGSAFKQASGQDVVIERSRPPNAPDDVPTFAVFTVVSALVTYEERSVAGGCSLQIGPASQANVGGDLGRIEMQFASIDAWSETESELNRRAVGGGQGMVTATFTLTCGSNSFSGTSQRGVGWMMLNNLRLSPDGRHLSGTLIETDAGGNTTTFVVDLTAHRQ